MVMYHNLSSSFKALVKMRKNRRRMLFTLKHLIGRRKHFTVEGRLKNKKRNRASVLQNIADTSDSYFKQMFRLDRPTFCELLELISPIIALNELGIKRAESSSGSTVPALIKLAMTLRFLAGVFILILLLDLEYLTNTL